MQALGRHVLLELFDCNVKVLNNLETVKGGLVEAARRAHATIVATTFHAFTPGGISAVVMITTSHLAIHTWPEHRYAAVDIFSCGDVFKPEVAISHLVTLFAAERVSIVEVQRGVLVQSAAPLPHPPEPTA